jgi:hypothetical protein
VPASTGKPFFILPSRPDHLKKNRPAAQRNTCSRDRNCIAAVSFKVRATSKTAMSDERLDHHADDQEEAARNGLASADVLAVLTVAGFLAAIGLITFFVTSALAT